MRFIKTVERVQLNEFAIDGGKRQCWITFAFSRYFTLCFLSAFAKSALLAPQKMRVYRKLACVSTPARGRNHYSAAFRIDPIRPPDVPDFRCKEFDSIRPEKRPSAQDRADAAYAIIIQPQQTGVSASVAAVLGLDDEGASSDEEYTVSIDDLAPPQAPSTCSPAECSLL